MSDNGNDSKAIRMPVEGHDGLFTFRNIERNPEREKQLINDINKQVEDFVKSKKASAS